MFAQPAQKLEPNRADLAAYLDMLFGYCEPMAGDDAFAYCIMLRGLGEKGTPWEGVFNEGHACTPIRSSFDVDYILGHVQRWARFGHAAFIVPATVAPATLSDSKAKATEDRILQFTTFLVDIDKGDTDAKLAHAIKHLGTPSMVVHSGGITETNHPKLHIYWRLTEPTADVVQLAAARKLLALKIGGDAAFGRCTQIIRIPGSVYGKSGVSRPCEIVKTSVAELEQADILEIVDGMDAMAGINLDPAMRLTGHVPPSVYSTGNGLNFSAFKEAGGDLAGDKPDIALTLNSDIAEGGDAVRNRWTEFNRAAGLLIHQARTGIIGLDRAAELTMVWIEEHMKPAWPQAKVDAEWRGLLDKDIRSHGPFLASGGARPAEVLPPVLAASALPANNPNVTKQIDTVRNLDGSFSEQQRLDTWRVNSWAAGEAPQRKFLVEGLIQAAKSHLLVAEGGAGKTFLLLDLGIKVASHTPEKLQSWCGMPLAEDAGGTVVMFTTEDDQEELQIRLSDLVKDKDRRAALSKLIIIPTINIGGAFAFVERERAQGPIKTGSQWHGWLDQLEAVGKDLKLVIIDTLNTTLHGEENSATVINEYIQATASFVCGKFGAAMVVTHHVRKPSSTSKVYTAEDMRNSIRGSTALVGSFRVALGIWQAPDFATRLSAIGRAPAPGQLYNFAVVKANNPQMHYGLRALLREKSGLLVDITDKESTMKAAVHAELSAWIIKAVAYAAERWHPLTVRAMSKMPPNGRKNQLPPILRDLSEREVTILLKRLIEAGRVAMCNPKSGKTYNYLDVPDGPLAKAMGEDGGAYRIKEGADYKPPDWKQYTYHVAEGRIVESGTEYDRTIWAGRGSGESVAPSEDASATAATVTTDATLDGE